MEYKTAQEKSVSLCARVFQRDTSLEPCAVLHEMEVCITYHVPLELRPVISLTLTFAVYVHVIINMIIRILL